MCRRCSPPRWLSFLAVSVPSLPSSSRRLSSLDRQRPPSPAVVFLWLSSLARQSPPSSAVFVAPALVPCPSASALACCRRRRRRHRRRRTATILALAGDDLSPRRPAAALAVPSHSVLRTVRPFPVTVLAPLPWSPPPPPTAVDAPGRSSPSATALAVPPPPSPSRQPRIAAMAFRYSSPFSSWSWRHLRRNPYRRKKRQKKSIFIYGTTFKKNESGRDFQRGQIWNDRSQKPKKNYGSHPLGEIC